MQESCQKNYVLHDDNDYFDTNVCYIGTQCIAIQFAKKKLFCLRLLKLTQAVQHPFVEDVGALKKRFIDHNFNENHEKCSTILIFEHSFS